VAKVIAASLAKPTRPLRQGDVAIVMNGEAGRSDQYRLVTDVSPDGRLISVVNIATGNYYANVTIRDYVLYKGELTISSE